MPPLALASLLQGALPWLSADGRAAVNTLICDNGRVGSAQALCERLGLQSRFQLTRLLRREGLPPYEELAGWICVFYWMLRADSGAERGALRPLAGETHMEVASSYRLVRRVTGCRWRDLRRAGTAQTLHWFQQRTRPPQSRRPPATARPPVSGPSPLPTALEPPNAVPQSGPFRLALAGAPYGIAVRKDVAYITRSRCAAVDRLDLQTWRLTGHVAVGCTPTCVTLDPTGECGYVSVQYLDAIAVIDARRHAHIRSMRVPGDPFPVLLSHRGHTLFVTTNADRLFALAPLSGRVLASLPLPATSHHLALHPAADRLYVATRAAGSVLEVDAVHYRVLRTFATGGCPQGLAVSPDGTTLYVANERHGLDVIRLATGTCVARLRDESGAVPLALSPEHDLLYVGHPRQGTVSVIAVSTLTRRGRLETGGRPGQIAFDAWGRVMITNEAGWLDILPIGALGIARAGAHSLDL